MLYCFHVYRCCSHNIAMELPFYFPKDCNRRTVGLQAPYDKKQSIVFQDFGRFGHVDVEFPDSESDSEPKQSSRSQSQFQPTFLAQRQHNKDQDRSHLCAQMPALPLSNTPTKVHYPYRDCIINDLPDQITKVRKFTRSLKQVSASVSGQAMWTKKFLAAKQTLDKHSDPCSIPYIHRQAIEENLPDSIRWLTDQYADLSHQPWLQSYNPHYSGGLLSCVADSSRNSQKHLLFHASGRKLHRLTLTQAALSDSHIFASEVLAESKVKAIYQVHAQSVHDQLFIGTRHKDSCTMFCMRGMDSIFDSVQPGDDRTLQTSRVEFVQIGSHCFDKEVVPTSLCISPYLSGEGLFCTNTGTICIWCADSGILRTMERPLRFPCSECWRHVYYASHPRHIVLVDQTCVQMVDHRDGFHNSTDLFALPNKLIHGKERIMSAHHHGNTSPLHTIATSHCLFLVDHRFASTPVLQLYPDLSGQLMYLASTDCDMEGNGRGGVLLAASQHPAQVICYPLIEGTKHAVTTPLNPWRLSKMSDFIDSSRHNSFLTGSDLFYCQERLCLSLGGVAVAKGAKPESIVCYQTDCYGELYFQQYSKPDSVQVACKMGIPATGQKDHHMPPEAQLHVKLWLQRLQEQINSMENLQKKAKQQRQETAGMDLCATNFEKLDPSSVSGVISCCSFCGDYEDILSPDGSSEGNKLVCPQCRLHRHHLGITSRPVLQSTLVDVATADCDATQPFCDFEPYLCGIAPPVEFLAGNLHDPEANTLLLMKLMKEESQSDLVELVEKREKERSNLLKDRKNQLRLIRENKIRKRQDSLCKRGLSMVDDSQPQPQPPPTHNMFFSEEHLQQNALIQQVLSTAPKSAAPVTIREDTGDGGSLESASDNEHPDDICDLSDSDKQHDEFAAEMPASLNLTQDDDEDFFSCQEDTPPKADASSVFTSKERSLTLSQDDNSSDLFSSDEESGQLCGEASTEHGSSTTLATVWGRSPEQRRASQMLTPSPPVSTSVSRTPNIPVTPSAVKTGSVPASFKIFSTGQSRSVLTVSEVNKPVFTTPQQLKSKSVENVSLSPRAALTSPRSKDVKKTSNSKEIKKSARRSLIGGF